MHKFFIFIVLVYTFSKSSFAIDEEKYFPLEVWQEIFSSINKFETIKSFALVSKKNYSLIFFLPKQIWLRREKELNQKLGFLSKCPSLISLTIDNCSTIKLDLDIFNSFSRIKSLALISCIFFSDDPLNFLSSFSALKKLNFAASNISDQNLKFLSHLTNLEELNLSSIIIIRDLKILTSFLNLRVLNLFNTLIDDQLLMPLTNLVNLTSINLSYCAFVQGEIFKNLTTLTNLRSLYLKKLKIKNKYLKPLSNLSNLKIIR